MKLLRTIRLDPSDTFIFPAAAEPGEWAISGAFVFADVEPATLAGKELAAFRSGFLGLPSLGWSTLAQIVEAGAEDRAAAIDLAARCLIERFGAPDLGAARKAAEEEIDFAASLCDHPPDTLIAVYRTDESGTIREAFRSLHPRAGPTGWRAFSVLEAEAEAEDEDEPDESVDLTSLARGDRA
ncbi:MAG TPA: DUF6505 family protein [Alphaproteobacteria bacterium]|nr:DUF6505 family protein [Alphaproteobacteria bacterium]